MTNPNTEAMNASIEGMLRNRQGLCCLAKGDGYYHKKEAKRILEAALKAGYQDLHDIPDGFAQEVLDRHRAKGLADREELSKQKSLFGKP